MITHQELKRVGKWLWKTFGRLIVPFTGFFTSWIKKLKSVGGVWLFDYIMYVMQLHDICSMPFWHVRRWGFGNYDWKGEYSTVRVALKAMWMVIVTGDRDASDIASRGLLHPPTKNGIPGMDMHDKENRFQTSCLRDARSDWQQMWNNDDDRKTLVQVPGKFDWNLWNLVLIVEITGYPWTPTMKNVGVEPPIYG